MQWFVVNITFQILIEGKFVNNEFDNQYRLISAENEVDAIAKAEAIAQKEEKETFLNNAGKKVTWRFKSINKIYPIEELKDGVELFSEISESKVINGQFNPVGSLFLN